MSGTGEKLTSECLLPVVSTFGAKGALPLPNIFHKAYWTRNWTKQSPICLVILS